MASAKPAASAGEVGLSTPSETWEALAGEPGALLVDVRTRAEWAFVGAPDLASVGKPLAMIEWRSFPAMTPNLEFLEELEKTVVETGAGSIHFICRSGARSLEAARAARAHFAAKGRDVPCFNVVEGFEGDLDEGGRRGGVNGWKVHGLPWRQS